MTEGKSDLNVMKKARPRDLVILHHFLRQKIVCNLGKLLHVPTAWSGAPLFARHISTNIDTWQVLPSSVDTTGSYLGRDLSNIACTKHGPCVNEYVYDVMGACSRYP